MPHRGEQHDHIVHAAREYAADENPEQAGHVAELGGQHGSEQGAGCGDGGEMVPEEHVLVGIHIVVAVGVLDGRRHTGVIQVQHLVCNEQAVKTTLVKGGVKLEAEGLRQTVILSPGEQAVWENKQMNVRQVNTKLYISWIKDRFAFESEELDAVLRRLARWYNVDFRVENPEMRKKVFSGTIPKYEDVIKVLEMIGMTTNISFTVKDNVVIIK